MSAKYLMLAAVLITSTAFGQQNKPNVSAKGNVTMERSVGDPMVVVLSANIKLNEGSTLNREAYVIRDSAAPLTFIAPNSGRDPAAPPATLRTGPSPRVVYKSGDRYSTGQYNYAMKYFVRPDEPIVAFELKSIAINIFGQLIKTLVSTEIRDINDTWQGDAEWRIWSENEASEAFAFITYINKVRTASGKFYEIDQKAVLAQAAKVANKLTEADLEPKLDPKK